MKKKFYVFLTVLLICLAAISLSACTEPAEEGKEVVSNCVLTVEGGTGSGTFEKGTQVTVAATVPSGKRFANWTVGGVEQSTNATYSFALNEDTTITANFVQLYTLTVEGGTIDGESSKTVDAGTSVTVVATVPDDEKFVKWTVGGIRVSENGSYTFAVNNNITITANFAPKPSLRYTLNSDGMGYSVAYGTSTDTNVVIPSTHNGLPVTSITSGGFSSITNLVSVVIPDSVISIADSAFWGSANLVTISIPDSVVSVGQGAFTDTAWYANQADGVVYAGKVACGYKGTMPANTSLTLLDGTKCIASQAFKDTANLISIVIPESVTVVGDYAFAYSGLTSIKCGAASQPAGWGSDWKTYCSAEVTWGYTGE